MPIDSPLRRRPELLRPSLSVPERTRPTQQPIHAGRPELRRPPLQRGGGRGGVEDGGSNVTRWRSLVTTCGKDLQGVQGCCRMLRNAAGVRLFSASCSELYSATPVDSTGSGIQVPPDLFLCPWLTKTLSNPHISKVLQVQLQDI